MSRIVQTIHFLATTTLAVIVALQSRQPQPAPAPVPVLTAIAIPATLDAQPGEALFIKAETKLGKVVWLSPDAGLQIIANYSAPNEAAVVAKDPGEYRLMAHAADGSNPVHSDWCIITVHGAQPPPGPEPTPDPHPPVPPAPIPTATRLRIITIDDVTARTQQTAALLSDTAFWRSLEAAGHDVQIRNSTDIPTTALAMKLPAIIIQDADSGRQLNAGTELTLPSDRAGVKALIEKYTGRKLAISLPEPHEPVIELAEAKAPVEVYYYTSPNCVYCEKLKSDVKDAKDFRFILAKEDDWSRAQAAAGNGYPMVRWQVDGAWNASQHGWAGLKEFARVWRQSQRKKVA